MSPRRLRPDPLGSLPAMDLTDLRVFTEPQQGASYADLLAVARRAEVLGFGAFFRSDHYLVMGDASGLPGPTDAWITLAGLARETSTIRLGTLVSAATFRLPGPLAISVAQVDAMSAGRVEFGFGAGWFEAEHAAYGIPFGSVGDRFTNLEEQLAIIHGLWITPDDARFDFAGGDSIASLRSAAARASSTFNLASRDHNATSAAFAVRASARCLKRRIAVGLRRRAVSSAAT